MKYRKCLLVAAALVVIGATSIKPAMAYFTDSRQASGTVTVYLGDMEITPHEEAKEWTKEITVENTGDYDVFVRVKAIYGSQYGVTLSSGTNWSYNEEDGYYYYTEMLSPEKTSSVLTLTIKANDSFEFDTFNVVIVQEAAKAQNVRDENGNVTGQKAVWDEAIMTQEKYKATYGDISSSTTDTTESTDTTQSTDTTNADASENESTNEGGNE